MLVATERPTAVCKTGINPNVLVKPGVSNHSQPTAAAVRGGKMVLIHSGINLPEALNRNNAYFMCSTSLN